VADNIHPASNRFSSFPGYGTNRSLARTPLAHAVAFPAAIALLVVASAAAAAACPRHHRLPCHRNSVSYPHRRPLAVVALSPQRRGIPCIFISPRRRPQADALHAGESTAPCTTGIEAALHAGDSRTLTTPSLVGRPTSNSTASSGFFRFGFYILKTELLPITCQSISTSTSNTCQSVSTST
jgi:hypothetical protein